jgi:DNA-directed RNA polymerase subunit K/omega
MSSKNDDYFSESESNSDSDNESISDNEENNNLNDDNDALVAGGEDIDILSDNESVKSLNEDEEENDITNNVENKLNISQQDETQNINQNIELDDDDDEYDEDENYLQKFNYQLNNNYVQEFHPECQQHNYEEVKNLTKVVRDQDNIIIDPFHKTQPFLTKYEKARILGQRSKQIESGADPMVKVPDSVIDSYIIAELELSQKKIPFIIKRPISNGGFEYWNVKDLEVINF